jgi:hypothetical protein
MLKNKKALEAGNTLVWLVATLLIFVLMMIYLFFVFLAFVKNGGKTNVDTFVNSENGSLLLQSFFSFLQQETIVNGKNLKVKDLTDGDFISKNQVDPTAKRFNELASEFKTNNKIKPGQNIILCQLKDKGATLNPPVEKIVMEDQFLDPCNPLDKKRFLFCILIVKDKKTFVCLERSK